MDAAEPSSNGVSASNLHRLASMLDDEEYARLARSTVAAFEAEIEQFPHTFAGMLASVAVARLGMRGVVLTGTVSEDVDKKLRNDVGVGRTVVHVGKGDEWLRRRSKLLGSMDVDKDAVMICEAGACKEGIEYL